MYFLQKSYIWAIEIDESRIFSGDSDACLVVHDFWNYGAPKDDSLPNKRLKCHTDH